MKHNIDFKTFFLTRLPSVSFKEKKDCFVLSDWTFEVRTRDKSDMAVIDAICELSSKMGDEYDKEYYLEPSLGFDESDTVGTFPRISDCCAMLKKIATAYQNKANLPMNLIGFLYASEVDVNIKSSAGEYTGAYVSFDYGDDYALFWFCKSYSTYGEMTASLTPAGDGTQGFNSGYEEKACRVLLPKCIKENFDLALYVFFKRAFEAVYKIENRED